MISLAFLHKVLATLDGLSKEMQEHTQGRAFQGRKFRIFLEKAIIALKHHSQHFLMEDFYIFIFLTFIVKKILVLISLPFFVIVLVLILIT